MWYLLLNLRCVPYGGHKHVISCRILFYLESFRHQRVMNPVQFYKCLADDTRLRCLLLILQEQELCVCELTVALRLSQPKVSRHLAHLRQAGLLLDHKQGSWVFYRLHPSLPDWIRSVLTISAHENAHFIAENRHNLSVMGSRPDRVMRCC